MPKEPVKPCEPVSVALAQAPLNKLSVEALLRNPYGKAAHDYCKKENPAELQLCSSWIMRMCSTNPHDSKHCPAFDYMDNICPTPDLPHQSRPAQNTPIKGQKSL